MKKTTRSSARFRSSAARPIWRNRPLGGGRSMTASWCTGCARASASPSIRSTASRPISRLRRPGGVAPPRGLQVPPEKRDPRGNFRFFENRQKYLLFVHTCSREAGDRGAGVAGIIQHPIHGRRRCGCLTQGSATAPVLARGDALDASAVSAHAILHRRQGAQPGDVRLTLDKVPDRLFEHPATVFVLTNMYYAEAPWLTPSSPAAASGMIWHEVALRGASSGEFEAQIAELGPFLEQNWRAMVSPRSGMPVYERAGRGGTLSGGPPFPA